MLDNLPNNHISHAFVYIPAQREYSWATTISKTIKPDLKICAWMKMWCQFRCLYHIYKTDILIPNEKLHQYEQGINIVYGCFIFRAWHAPSTFRKIVKLPPVIMRNLCPYQFHVFMWFILVMNITEIMVTSSSSTIVPSTGMLLYIYYYLSIDSASNVCGTGIGLPDVNLCNAITCSQLVVISLYPHH